MPDNIPGHDVRNEHRNTDNFAKGVEDHAPEGTAQQGLEIAGEASGMRATNIVDLHERNDQDTSTPGIQTYATDAPDIFVYDFSQADATTWDSFQIYYFDSSEDTLIFTNTEVPMEMPDYEYEAKLPHWYMDEERDNYQSPNEIGERYVIQPPTTTQYGDPFYAITWTKIGNDSDIAYDPIYLYEDEGPTTTSPSLLSYPDDTMDPTPNDTYAYVYEGDPLAVEGIA